MKYKYLILFIMLAMIITSCKATPSELVVTSKDTALIEDTIVSKSYTEENENLIYTTQSNWKDCLITNNEDLSITIDAEIIIPASGILPIASIEPIDINNEMANSIVEILFNGEKIYIGDGIKTISELEQDIIIEKAKYTDPKSVINMQTDEKMKEIKKNNTDENIKKLIEQLKIAPTEHTKTEATEFIEISNSTWGFAGSTMLNKNYPAMIRIVKYNDNLLNRIQFFNLDNDSSIRLRTNGARKSIYLDDQKNISNLRELNISVEDAKKMADEKVINIAGEEFCVYEIGSSLIRMPFKHSVFSEYPQCYLFRYMRKVNDTQVTYDNTVVTNGEFAKPRLYESISVCVDDSGIIAFEWNSPSKVSAIIEDSVKLLSFGKIQDVFRKQIEIEGVFNVEFDIIKRNIVIDEIKLGLMSIAQKDSPNKFILIPVWNFYGYTQLLFNDQSDTQLILNDDNAFTYRNYQYSFLTINAIDGSIIDRSLGY